MYVHLNSLSCQDHIAAAVQAQDQEGPRARHPQLRHPGEAQEQQRQLQCGGGEPQEGALHPARQGPAGERRQQQRGQRGLQDDLQAEGLRGRRAGGSRTGK